MGLALRFFCASKMLMEPNCRRQGTAWAHNGNIGKFGRDFRDFMLCISTRLSIRHKS